jgi:DNA polymerase-3 subunit gamma/tau
MSDLLGPDSGSAAPDPGYRVLARKYRPATFEQLLGQEAMVRTLGNAIRRDRLAQAWLLTGVRGVGKTSTARIIAKALNCIGPDGQGGPTIEPCGVCEPCVAIAAGRHIDVVEMDAASNTGVDDIREIIEGVRYASVSARFKIHIIDEVHMLSKNAFNALLKTLEEPPPHVKFIFATTEVQKVPVTVLSRCQRFDLRRVPADTLAAHFADIVAKEGAEAEPEALALIARAAEGSVRDGLSVLDQAIVHGAGKVSAEAVRDMLGLADRGAVRRLFGVLLAGDADAALAGLADQYAAGLDPEMLIREFLGLVHQATRLKMSAGAGALLSSEERGEIGGWAERLSFPALHRLWQLLLKALAEVQAAPDPLIAAEMAMLRIIHAGDLPDPGELVRRVLAGDAGPGEATPPPGRAAPPASAPVAAAPVAAPVAAAPLSAATRATDVPASFAALVEMFGERREPRLAHLLHDELSLVDFAPPSLVLAADRPQPDAARAIRQCLADWTGMDWTVRIDSAAAARPDTLRQQQLAAAAAREAEVRADPVVAALFESFPEAELLGIEPVERTAHAQSR